MEPRLPEAVPKRRPALEGRYLRLAWLWCKRSFRTGIDENNGVGECMNGDFPTLSDGFNLAAGNTLTAIML